MFLFYCIMCHSIMHRCSAYYSFNDKLNYLLIMDLTGFIGLDILNIMINFDNDN